MKQKIADLLNVLFGFRQTLVMLMVILIGIIFRIRNLISGEDMVGLIKTTTVAFMGTSSVAHMITTVKEYMNAKGQVVKSETDDTGPLVTTETEKNS